MKAGAMHTGRGVTGLVRLTRPYHYPLLTLSKTQTNLYRFILQRIFEIKSIFNQISYWFFLNFKTAMRRWPILIWPSRIITIQ